MEFRTLLPWELDAWFDHCALVFDQYHDLDASRQYFMNHWHNDPWRDRHAIFVAVDSGEIASTVRVFHRRIYLNGREFTMGGIGEVSTKMAYRRQGLSGRLLEMAVRYMETEGLDFSMLGTGTPKHYSRYGWEEVPIYCQQAKVAPARSQHVRLINLQEARELQRIMGLYHRYSRNFNGPVLRDHERYWTDWVRCEIMRGWLPQEIGRGWVLQEDNDIIAYLVATKHAKGNFMVVQDFACLGEVAPCFRRLVQHAVASLYGEESSQVIFPAGVASDFPVKWERRDGLMIRVNRAELWERLPEQNVVDLFHGGKGATNDASRLVTWGLDDF